MKPIADDVQGVVIPDTGRWVAEEAHDEMLAALTPFLTPTATDRPRRSTAGRTLLPRRSADSPPEKADTKHVVVASA